MSYINQDKVSKNENRNFEVWKPLFNSEKEFNYNFGKDFNNWFNDRFNLRQFLLDVHTYILVDLTGKAEKGIIDKSGFLYRDFEINHNVFAPITSKDYEAMVKFNEYCKKHNIELYVLVVPDKEYVYIPTNKIIIKDKYSENIDKELKKLKETYNMNIVNPIEALKSGCRENYMYFKTEHHWTDDGAFIGYKELMKEINKKHRGIYTLQEKDFDFSENIMVNSDWYETYYWGSTASYINLPWNYIKKLHKDNYRYYTHKNSNLLKKDVVDIAFHRLKKYNYPNGADYRVILLGTSQNENLCKFLPYTFKNVLRIRNNNVMNIPANDEFKIIKYHEKEILDYKPDILVFGITYDNLHGIHKLFDME